MHPAFRFSLFLLSFLSFRLVSASHLPNRNRLVGLLQPEPHPRNSLRRVNRRSCLPSPPTETGSCFPALGFKMPSEVPTNTNGWWCNPTEEYAFLGFSYEITACEFQHVPCAHLLMYDFLFSLQVRVCPSYRRISPTFEILSMVVTFAFTEIAKPQASSTIALLHTFKCG